MPRTTRRSTVAPFTRTWRPRSHGVDADTTALAAEMASLFPRLSPSLQRAFVGLARHLTGHAITRTDAYDRAGDVVLLYDEAEQLARALLAGCGERE